MYQIQCNIDYDNSSVLQKVKKKNLKKKTVAITWLCPHQCGQTGSVVVVRNTSNNLTLFIRFIC